MIMYNMKPFSVKARNTGVDSYGQALNTFTAVKTVDISVLLLSQAVNVSTPLFEDSTHIGLTFDKTLTDNMTITNGSITYLIQLVNPYGRMAQLTLQEVK